MGPCVRGKENWTLLISHLNIVTGLAKYSNRTCLPSILVSIVADICPLSVTAIITYSNALKK